MVGFVYHEEAVVNAVEVRFKVYRAVVWGIDHLWFAVSCVGVTNL